MSVDGRVELAWKLWHSVLEEANVPLTQEQKNILDERLRDSLEHPESSLPWEQVMQELESRYRNV